MKKSEHYEAKCEEISKVSLLLMKEESLENGSFSENGAEEETKIKSAKA